MTLLALTESGVSCKTFITFYAKVVMDNVTSETALSFFQMSSIVKEKTKVHATEVFLCVNVKV